MITKIEYQNRKNKKATHKLAYLFLIQLFVFRNFLFEINND